MFRRNTNNRKKSIFTKWWFWLLLFWLIRSFLSNSQVVIQDTRDTQVNQPPEQRIDIPIERGGTNTPNPKTNPEGRIQLPIEPANP